MVDLIVEGDRVELIEDFNNEPGTIPKGTQGVVDFFYEGRHISHYYYVKFEGLSPEFYSVIGYEQDQAIPMLRKEIRKVN